MRKWWIFFVMALVLVSCGATEDLMYSEGAPALGESKGLCETFIDQTALLDAQQNASSYRAILGTAVRPVIDYAVDHELWSDDNQDLGFALERLYAGDA